jgi:hypothetical protein
MRRIITAAAIVLAALAPAACGSPAAPHVTPAARASNITPAPSQSTFYVDATIRQEKNVCTELRATVRTDRYAGMPFNPVQLEWQIAAQYKASGGSIAGAFDILGAAVNDECPSLAWTLNDMQQS